MHPARTSARIAGFVRHEGAPARARIEVRLLRPADPDAGMRRSGGYGYLDPSLLDVSRRRVPPDARVEAGEDGRFEIADLAPGTYLVAASSPAGAATESIPLTPGERRATVLDLEPRREALVGRVVHADGRPWTGRVAVASARSFPRIGPPFAPEVVPTDAEGRFVADGLPASEVEVVALGEDGTQVVGRTVRLPTREVYTLTIDADTVPIAGRVVRADDGTPVAGAEVAGRSEWSPEDSAAFRASTDRDGAFRVLVPAANGTILVRARGFTRFEQPVEAGRTTLEVRLARAARLWGRVTSATDGSALAGVQVWMQRKDAHAMAARFVRSQEETATSGDDGRYEVVDLVPGTYAVVARGRGFVAEAFLSRDPVSREATVAPDSEARLDLRMVPGARIVGTVRGLDGAGVPGLRVYASARPTSRDFLARELPSYSAFSGLDPAVTGTGGDYRIESLVPGVRYEVRVGSAGTPLPAPKRGVAPGSGRELRLDFRLPAPRFVEVAVVDEESREPVPYATVAVACFPRSVDPSDEDDWTSRMVASTGETTARADASGHARVGPVGEGEVSVSAGDYRLTAEGGPPDEHRATASVAAGAGEVELRLAPVAEDPRRLRLRVLDPEGRPVPAASASFLSDSGGRNVSVQDGRAELVLDDDSAADGEEGLLEVEYARDRSGALLPLGRVRTSVRTGRALEVRLPPERTIKGRVLGPDGRGVANARVRADPMGPPGEDYPVVDEPLHWTRADAVLTDEAGAFRVGHLGDGNHRVFVLPPQEYVPPEAIRTTAGATGLEFRVKRGLSAAVRVLDPDGKALPGARVVVARGGGDRHDLTIANLFTPYGPGAEVVADGTGEARLLGLDASLRYVLGVRGPESRSDLGRHLDPRWSPHDVTVRLTRGLAVSGAVRDRAGAPCDGVHVSATDDHGVWASRTTDAEGRFRFTGLPRGGVLLEARWFRDGPERRAYASKRVAAGDEEVELVLDRPDR